ncbi:MAG: hypothetical protein PHX04_05010 [Bacilli bacterium]|nr:hypothetical protein [Bacilli bacterium]
MSKINIYHQCGFRYSWNLDICRDKNIGDGFILSPKDMEKNYLASMEDGDLARSFFDPQFYALSLMSSQYLTYGFHDYIENLSDYSKERLSIAQKNIDYQNSINIKYLTIPTIDFELQNVDEFDSLYLELFGTVYDGNDGNNLDLLNELVIKPFTEYIKTISTNKKVLLTIIFDENTAKNNDKFNELITLITSYDVVDGIYLIPKCARSYKRISNIQFLLKIMEFINILKNNNMEVIIGNCDIESLLYIVAGADAISLGIYENLRYYDGKRFIDSEQKRGPNPRMFSYKLLQWIDYTYLFPISEYYEMKEIFDDNEYYELTQIDSYKWHFLKSEPYKHYMISFCKIIDTMPDEINEKIKYVNQLLTNAQEMNTDLENNGIILDDNSGGTHLSYWRTILLQYKKKLLGSD